MRLPTEATRPGADDRACCARRIDDRGFTLVELCAALTVLAIGIVGVIGVMNGSFRVAGSTSARSKAVSIATRHIEDLRAVQYDQLQLAVAQQCPSPSPSQPPACPPEKVGGITYKIQKAVVLKDAKREDGTTVPGGYKEAVVSVSWTDSKFHEIHQSTIIYPGGLGPFSAANGVVAANGGGNPLAPSNLVATALVTGSPGVDLVWTPPVGSNPDVATYEIQFSTDASFATYSQLTSTLPATTPALRVTSLAADTFYSFRVRSKASNGNVSASWATAYNIRTAAAVSGLATCGLGTATITPAGVNKRTGNSGGLLVNPTITINAQGSCSTTALHMTYSTNATTTITSNLTFAGSAWTGTVDGLNQSWDVGDHIINVYDAGQNLRASLRLTVCDKQKRVCP